MAERQPSGSTHHAYLVIRREGQDDFWLNTGLVLPYWAGGEFNLIPEALSLDDKIVYREITHEVPMKRRHRSALDRTCRVDRERACHEHRAHPSSERPFPDNL